MTILNQPTDGLPSVLVALWRAVVAYGPVSEERLLSLCAPSTVVGDKPTKARQTLTRWKQLGMFTIDTGDRVDLTPEFQSVSLNDIDDFRRAVLRLVLSDANNTALTSDKESESEASLASDFTRAASWVLAQDAFAMPATAARADALQGEQGVVPRPFTNDTRWQGLVEWATFCGLALSTARTFIPNPAFAIRAVLGAVFEGSKDLPQDAFLVRLASTLPVVDGGAYRAIVDATIARPWRKFSGNELSVSLSLALQQLEASGDLILESRSDAPQRRLLGAGGREVRTFSHIIRAGVRS